MIDDPYFIPVFETKVQNVSFDPIKILKICGDSSACIHDLAVSGDIFRASITKKSEAMIEKIRSQLSEEIIRCPALPRPQNGRKTENRYWPGTLVTFVCDKDYRLYGYQVRKCNEYGLWSWGVDPECIPNSTYFLTIFSFLIMIILPISLIIFLIICINHFKN